MNADRKPKVFSGIQPNRAEDARQLQRRLPPVRPDAGDARRVLLHRRPALDQRRLRPRDASELDARPSPAMLFATGLDADRSTVFCQSPRDGPCRS